MGAAHGRPKDHAVPFGKEVVKRKVQIGKSAVKARNALLLFHTREGNGGRAGVPFVVWGEKGERRLASVPDFVDVATHEGFMAIDGHGFLLRGYSMFVRLITY